MRDHYSLYEAKARLSALVRQAREGGPSGHHRPGQRLRPSAGT
jgi:hypothetical protein